MKWLNPGIWLAILLAIAAAGGVGYWRGAKDVRSEWQAEQLQAERQAEQNRLLRQAAINQPAKRFAEKAAKDRIITQTIIKEVDRYVPNSLPMLPGDFRLYHDAAAAGTPIDDSRRADAAAVAPRAVAVTVAENYASSNYDKQRLEALQQIVRASGCFDVGE